MIELSEKAREIPYKAFEWGCYLVGFFTINGSPGHIRVVVLSTDCPSGVEADGTPKRGVEVVFDETLKRGAEVVLRGKRDISRLVKSPDPKTDFKCLFP